MFWFFPKFYLDHIWEENWRPLSWKMRFQNEAIRLFYLVKSSLNQIPASDWAIHKIVSHVLPSNHFEQATR